MQQQQQQQNPRLEALLVHLTDQVATLSRTQAEARRAPLSRPLLAAVDSLLPGVNFDQDACDQLRRALRLADSLEDPDDVVASVLPAIWEQLCLAPHLTDNRLLTLAIDNLPVNRTGRPLSLSSASLLPSGHSVRPVAAARGVSAAVQPALVAPAAPANTEPCFKCGRYDHSRSADCQHTTTRGGEPIPAGQKCRFAPAQWKARYGFDSRGYAAAGRRENEGN